MSSFSFTIIYFNEYCIYRLGYYITKSMKNVQMAEIK